MLKFFSFTKWEEKCASSNQEKLTPNDKTCRPLKQLNVMKRIYFNGNHWRFRCTRVWPQSLQFWPLLHLQQRSNWRVNKVQQAVINQQKKLKSLQRKSIFKILHHHSVMDAFHASAKQSEGKCHRNCISPQPMRVNHPSHSTHTERPASRARETGDASASVEPDVCTCRGLTCTVNTDKATDRRARTTDSGLFFSVNCFCFAVYNWKSVMKKMVPWMYH